MLASEAIKILQMFIDQGLDLPIAYEDDGKTVKVDRIVHDIHDEEHVLWLV